MTSVTASGGAGRRVGVLGGTFDPPHIGHLLAAVTVRHALALDLVLLVPAGDPWQKTARGAVTPAEIRVAMVEAAAEDLRGVAVSRIEVDRSGPSYTVDTLRALHDEDPTGELTLILGREAAAGLPTWERPDEVGQMARIAVVDRPGPRPDLPSIPDLVEVAMPQIEVSSTDLRRRVATGEPVEVLIPPAVVALIARHGLYRI